MALIKEVARRKAEAVLEDFWDDRLPIDPVRIAQDLNMQVFRADLPDGESGLIVKESGKSAEIYLNENEPDARQNFTCAHELGHWFERERAAYDEYSFVDRRGDKKDAHEWYAEHFAANLLMPARTFIQFFDEGCDVRELAQVFGVSNAADLSRLRGLRLRDA